MLDLSKLAPSLMAVLEVADSGSFSAAARNLRQTPAGIAQRVARFEARLGFPVFERTTRSMRLTARGHQVVQLARETVVLIEKLNSPNQ